MLSRRSSLGFLTIAPILLVLGVTACSKDSPRAHGTCLPSTNAALQCDAAVLGDASVATGLVGYSCTGTARPDEDPNFVEGVPQGLVCSDRGLLDDNTRGYCCSSTATTCAYNPVASCASPLYGYQCRGADRPDAFNSQLLCAQGVYEGDLIDYCCADTASYPKPNDGCSLTGNPGCPMALMGWQCFGSALPTEDKLGANKSKADISRLVCSVPTPTANPTLQYYCCYIPAVVPIGGSCVQDTTVPDCHSTTDAVTNKTFRFGFACYGPETPDQDYPPMHCSNPGVPGTSAEGYPATLYCCEY